MARFIGNEIIRISVIDTGCGIDPDEIQLLGKKIKKIIILFKNKRIHILILARKNKSR